MQRFVVLTKIIVNSICYKNNLYLQNGLYALEHSYVIKYNTGHIGKVRGDSSSMLTIFFI